jgi:L-ascorbate metabolism protein UlaG (beta-lactamase superfamily)
VGIEVSGKNVLIDPFISGNPKASHIDVNALKADYILLTHAHQDHILDVETIAKNNNSVVVSNYEIASHFGNKGLQYHPMNHGGSWQFEFGKVKYVPIHTSSFPDGS